MNSPDQLGVVSQALTALRDRLHSQEESETPLEVIRAKKRLRELEPVYPFPMSGLSDDPTLVAREEKV